MVSLRYLVTAALAAVTPIVSALPTGQLELTPDQIVSNIKMLTVKSQALQAPANSITIVNGPLIIVGLGPFPQIIAGFTDIISTTTIAIAQMSGTPPLTNQDDASAVADAFREFVRVHQVLLNILIGKAGLFQTVPFIGQPVSAVLRQLENVVDTIAFSIIDLLEPAPQREQVESGKNSLDSSLTIVIQAYEGLAINSKQP